MMDTPMSSNTNAADFEGTPEQANPNRDDQLQQIKHLEGDLRMTLEEIARLQNALAEANMKLMAISSASNESVPNASPESILQPLIKDLRQPLITIKGYLELLLNESVGTLGNFQRRFIERIQKAVEHMEESFDNLQKKQTDERDEHSLFAQSFSVRKTIESTLDLFAHTIKSKEIVLKINVPYEDIRLFADEESCENILNILITNATAALNSGGSLTITTEKLLTDTPQEVITSIESADVNVVLRDMTPVLPEMYKNQGLTLPGFGLPLGDIVRALARAKKMGGRIELFSNSCGAMAAKFHLPMNQGETL